MFINKWQITFLYIGRMDLGAGHLTIIVGTGSGAFCRQKLPAGPGIWQNFSSPRGLPGGLPGGGMLAAGIHSYITD